MSSKSKSIRFGIPSLDYLFSPQASVAKEFGIRMSLNSKDELEKGTTSLSLIGRSGTGKSLLGLHLASRYLADCLNWKDNKEIKTGEKPNLAKVFYISTDLTHVRAKNIWNDFGLHRPNSRVLPFGEDTAISSAQEQSKIDAMLEIDLKPCLFGSNQLADALLNSTMETEFKAVVHFIDLASSTAGDDWALVMRLLALLPPRRDNEPKHLLILDAVEGLETFAGAIDLHGRERSRRSRIAQVLRTAGKKCHVAFILEETRITDVPAEEYVTDVVLRLWATETEGYLRTGE